MKLALCKNKVEENKVIATYLSSEESDNESKKGLSKNLAKPSDLRYEANDTNVILAMKAVLKCDQKYFEYLASEDKLSKHVLDYFLLYVLLQDAIDNKNPGQIEFFVQNYSKTTIDTVLFDEENIATLRNKFQTYKSELEHTFAKTSIIGHDAIDIDSTDHCEVDSIGEETPTNMDLT